MLDMTVMFHSVNEITAFVSLANRQPFDVRLLSQEAELDGKSILGLFGLRLNRPMTLRVPEGAQGLEAFLEQVRPFLFESEAS